jgi:hypothetical protein
MGIRPIERTPIGRSGRIASDHLARRRSEQTLIGFIAIAWMGGDITTKNVRGTAGDGYRFRMVLGDLELLAEAHAIDASLHDAPSCKGEVAIAELTVD